MLPRECFVYVVHATALTIFGIFFMHVQVIFQPRVEQCERIQVTTRLLLASSPVLPWLAAILTTRFTINFTILVILIVKGKTSRPWHWLRGRRPRRRRCSRLNAKPTWRAPLIPSSFKCYTYPLSSFLIIFQIPDLFIINLINGWMDLPLLNPALMLKKLILTIFQEKLDTDVSRWVMMYFLGYTLVGTILFCNHLPWT